MKDQLPPPCQYKETCVLSNLLFKHLCGTKSTVSEPVCSCETHFLVHHPPSLPSKRFLPFCKRLKDYPSRVPPNHTYQTVGPTVVIHVSGRTQPQLWPLFAAGPHDTEVVLPPHQQLLLLLSCQLSHATNQHGDALLLFPDHNIQPQDRCNLSSSFSPQFGLWWCFWVTSYSHCVLVATVKHLGFILRWGTWQLFILLSYTQECPHQPNNKLAPPDHGKFTLLCKKRKMSKKKEWTFEVLTCEDMNPWNWTVEHQK